MNSISIVHPDYIGALSAMFVETVTIQAPGESRGDYGEVSEAWTDVANLTNLKAAVAPSYVSGQGEYSGYPRTFAVRQYEVGLQGYYPSIKEKQRLKLWDRVFDIIGVFQSPLRVYTQLTVREVA